jgi:Uma2 family endonuclease
MTNMALPQYHQEPQKFTEAEYLALENAGEVRHEFINGEIFAMTGASLQHIMITTNLTGLLYPHTRQGKCQIYNADMCVRTQHEITTNYVYPDLTMVCGEPEFSEGKRAILLNPTLVAEVLSPSTEHRDRSAKFYGYRQLESLQHYWLISQHIPLIESYTRRDDGWLFTQVEGLESQLQVPLLGISLALADIYERVTFDK